MALFRGARNKKTNYLHPLFNRHLTDDGLITGAHNSNIDGSLSNVDYFIEAKAGEIIRIARMIVLITDTGSFDSGGYGNGPALTNGMIFWIQQKGGPKIDWLNGERIKTNIDWAGVSFDTVLSAYGQGDEALSNRWTMAKYNEGKGVTLLEGDKAGIRITDNMTNLNRHEFLLQGVQLGVTDPGWVVEVPELPQP